jgi:glucose/arabinose dehydrogenase
MAIFASPAASAPSLPSGFQDSVVFGGLEEPTALRFSPDGRVFVAEKEGKILVYDSLEDSEPTEFADLRTDVYDYGDRGLLGLALDPDFPQRPYVYALYTYDHILGEAGGAPKWGEPDHSGDECPQPEGACEVSGRLVRLTADGGGDHAVVGGGGHPAQKVLVEDWCQQFSSHSIGDLQFDSAGALYASGGDGASFSAPDEGQFGNPCGDPPGEGGALRAQDARTPASPGDPTGLDGSVIRIDPETGEGLPGNPMFGSSDPNERRIIGYGFRNPFRFTIDPANDEVYVGNVGWNTFEEIDRFPTVPSPPYNSGWPCYEGPEPNPSYESLGLGICEDLYGDPSAVTPPLFYYRHANTIIPEDGCTGEGGWVVSGLAVYHGASFPSAYDGALFFSDPVRGCIYAMFPASDGDPDPLTTATFMSDGGAYPGIDVEVGPGGDLYYTKLFDVTRDGTVHRISYDPGAPIARLTATPQWGAKPLNVELDASGSEDPDGEELEYEWDLDGNGTFEKATGAEGKLTHSFGGGNHLIAVRVKDQAGAESTAKVTVYPGDSPPTPEIEEPNGSLTWRVGQKIEFAGSAVDSDGHELPESDLYWKARLYHCPSACHAHPLQVFPGVGGGSFLAPDHEYPSHIEIILTATDSRGLSATRSVSVYPRSVELAIGSVPPGLQLSAGIVSTATPFTLTAIEGSQIVLSAPATAELGGEAYAWKDWSDGGGRVHTVEAGDTHNFTADYAAPGGEPPNGEPSVPGKGGPAVGPIGVTRGPPLYRPRTVMPSPLLGVHPDKRTHSKFAKFTFSSSDFAKFRCRLDRQPFEACRSPRDYRHLRVGRHTFEVVALGASGGTNSAPRVFEWQVVARGPEDLGGPLGRLFGRQQGVPGR